MEEDLMASLSTQTRITLEEDDLSLVHPRYSQYKAKTSRSSQEERRKQWLVEQKNKRLESFNLHRGISDESNESETNSKTHQKERDLLFSNKLMLSVWLVEVPTNIEKEWYFVVCPQGRRTLVVAERGATRAYTRHGECIMKFPSELPGGRKENNGYTVIDCIWDHTTKTYFILDVLTWGIPLTNCEAELRFFWLKNKYAERPELGIPSKLNRHKFVLLDHNYVSYLEQTMLVHPAFEKNEPKVDGVIFFHKDSLYTEGKSPLVTWLKPFMIADILGIKINEEYQKEIPLSYLKNMNEMELEEEASANMVTEPAVTVPAT